MEAYKEAATGSSRPEPGARPEDVDDDKALLQAAVQGDAQRVQGLLAAGADACYQACIAGPIPGLARSLHAAEGVAERCMHALQDVRGQNALMLASAVGHTEVAALLLEAGAPWNALDRDGYCAGDFAMQSGHQGTVDLLLDAGVRAELVLGALERKLGRAKQAADAATYLQQRVSYEGDQRLMDPQERAVMMAWEGPLMEAHAHAVCAGQGDVLNVGFGLGLVDEAIQRRQPRTHTIVEAHPDVHAHMLELGWDRRPGVTVLFGRWQDVLPKLGRRFDGVFFDTYSEYYGDMQDFHELLPRLLREDGIYSYFNGLAADNAFFHAVYCALVKGELSRLGLETDFVALPINVADPKVWEGVQNRYWQLDTYFLPVCRRAGVE